MKRTLCGMMILGLCLFYFVRLGKATTDNWYVNSACAHNSDGTGPNCSAGAGGPFNVLSSLNWTTIAGEVTAGDTVNVLLARGSVFHATLASAASGAAGRPITIGAYSTGAKPIITGADQMTGWDASAAPVYSVAETTATPALLTMNGQIYEKGGSLATLNNHEWWWAANVLYFRENAGNPDTLGEDVECSVRSWDIYIVNRSYITLSNLRLTMNNDTNGAVDASGANSWSVADCDFFQTYKGLTWTGASGGTLAVSRCLFDQIQKAEAIDMGGTSIVVTVDHSLFRRNRNIITNLNTGTGALELDNCTILGSGLAAITTYTGGTTTIKNTVIDGVAYFGADTTFSGSGTATYSNSLINPGIFLATKATGGTVGTGNVFGTQPSYVHQAYPAWVTVTLDNIDTSAKATDKSRVSTIARTILGDASAGVTLAARYTATMDSWTGFINAVAAGDEVSNHTRHHEPIDGTITGPTVQYTGSGDPATMTVSGTTFSTSCTGATGDNLSFDLATASPDRRTTNQFCATLTATGKYTCTGGGDTGSQEFADISGQGIKTGTYQILLDSAKMLADEVGGATADIQAGISGYTVKTLAYPTGVYNAAALTYLASSGLIGARAWGTNGLSVWLQNLGLYIINGTNISDEMNAQFILSDTFGTAQDSGFKSSHSFTNHGTTTTVTGKVQTYSNYRAAAFNGTSQYMDWTPTADMDLTHKDWIISAYVTPTTLSDFRTVFFNGNDVNNYHTLYLSADGSAHYRIVTGGTEVAVLDTAAGTFANGSSYPLVIRSYKGQLQLMHGSSSSYYADIVDQAITAVAPLNYTGTFYYGCAYDYTGSARLNYWAGEMCDLYMASNPAQNIWSQLNQLTEYGGIMGYTGHEDWTYDSWAFFFQIVKDFQGYTDGLVKVRTFAAALTEIRANSAITEDGLYSRWYPTDLGDYRVVTTSPLVGAGASLGYTTDFAGATVPATPYIGAYETSPAAGSGKGGMLLLLGGRHGGPGIK